MCVPIFKTFDQTERVAAIDTRQNKNKKGGGSRGWDLWGCQRGREGGMVRRDGKGRGMGAKEGRTTKFWILSNFSPVSSRPDISFLFDIHYSLLLFIYSII